MLLSWPSFGIMSDWSDSSILWAWGCRSASLSVQSMWNRMENSSPISSLLLSHVCPACLVSPALASCRRVWSKWMHFHVSASTGKPWGRRREVLGIGRRWGAAGLWPCEVGGIHTELATAKVKQEQMNWSMKGICYNLLGFLSRGVLFLVSEEPPLTSAR